VDAQTFNGSSLSHKSSGNGSGNWTLDENGYVGTYITLASPGDVTLTVNASGSTTDAVAPRMNIVIADTKAGFDVASGFDNYQHTFDLPAGTYFVRTEFNNDIPGADRQLTVGSLNVSGASVSNSNNSSTKNANALAAADTYIGNFRRGPADVAAVGAAPGTPVHVKLKTHDFLFGTAVGGINNLPSAAWIAPNPAPGSDAANLQQRILENFNAVVPGNAGKWQQNEFGRDSLYSPVLNDLFDFAEQNSLRMRMHNMLWGNQQPSWVNTLLNNAQSSNPTTAAEAKIDLRNEITERIAYYLGNVGTDWSDRYQHVDILNESVHVPVYMDIFGADGIAEIYADARQAALNAGNNVDVYANEYNVLQDSGDFYGNWYRQHIEELNNAGFGKVVTGIGIQSYENNAIGSSFNAHYPARKMQTLQNLSVLGLPITLTEFGVKGPSEGHFTSEADAAQMVDETLRLVFGTPLANGFFMWGFTDLDIYREGATFYDSNWNPREPLAAWQNLMSAWDTDLTLEVGPDGTIDFTGFYGDYEITIGDQTFSLNLLKGTQQYSLVVAPGDYNGDGAVDASDYTVWRDAVGSTSDLRADGNGDGTIDEADYAIWKSLFGTSYGSGQASIAVPEPAGAVLLVLGGVMLTARRLRSRTN
jgi:endo-1,4-beta-xylanase